MLTTSYLINRTRSSILDGTTTYSIIYSRDPSYDNLFFFGTLCYVQKQGRSGKDLIVGLGVVYL